MRQGRFFLILFFTCYLMLIPFVGCDEDDDSASSVTQADDDDASDEPDDDDDDDDNQDNDDQGADYCTIDEDRVKQILDQMSLKRKIAQMYYVGVDVFPWFDLPDVAEKIQTIGVGAVHAQVLKTIGPLNSWTVKNINKLQNFALKNDLPIPLFVGIDQEGGAPQAMSTTMGGTDTPGNMGLGATFDSAATASSYALMANQLSELGINVTLAPVLDVMTSSDETSMYTRCFGQDPEQVAAHAAAAVSGTQNQLVIAAAKHFPGQTAAPGDEHLLLTVSQLDETTLRQTYLKPFAAAVEAGVEMIMPTHARFAAWDEDYPATLSSSILTGLLRDELGFEGIIITDDMNMVGVTGKDWGELPDLLAIQAGADMIMDIFDDFDPSGDKASSYPDDLEGQIDYLVTAVNDGRLAEERIDESVRKILRLKMKYCLFENPLRDVEGIGRKVDTPQQQALAKALHEKAITLVRNDEDQWPLSLDAPPMVHVIAPAPIVWEMYPGAEWPNLSTKTLFGTVKKFDGRTTGVLYSSPLSKAAKNRILSGAEQSDAEVFVMGTYNALYDDVQTDLIKQLLNLGRPTVLFALAMPYDLAAFPEAQTYFNVYSNHDLAVEAAARVLYGLADPTGRLPVSIDNMYEVGWSALEK